MEQKEMNKEKLKIFNEQDLRQLLFMINEINPSIVKEAIEDLEEIMRGN